MHLEYGHWCQKNRYHVHHAAKIMLHAVLRRCCWCWLRSEWRTKTIQTYPYSNCTFHHQNSQRKQTSFTVPTDLGKTLANTICCMYVSLSACWKTGQNPCKNKHGENCIAQVVCWYFVRLCGTACWLRSERWRKSIRTYPYSNCTFQPPEFTKKTNTFYRTNQPRENFGQHNPLHVFLSA